MQFCHSEIKNRSKKYKDHVLLKCHLESEHIGPCEEFPYLKQMNVTHESVAEKIVRDATMTTGASWKSKNAGPNRILRWIMLLDDAELLKLNIDVSKLKPGVISKLRDKAATYDECMQVAAKLTWVAYQMEGAPTPDDYAKSYLEPRFGIMRPGSTQCVVCKDPISFGLFAKAVVGKAEIETAHKNPRLHNAENVGFAHRPCNIAQGNKTLSEFYVWIRKIIDHVDNS